MRRSVSTNPVAGTYLHVITVQEMICVEAALATSGPVELAPGDNWVGTQVLKASSL